MDKIRIGSRSSPLAKWQTNYITRLIIAYFPEMKIEITEIKTSGDKILDTPLYLLGDKGLFTKEIESEMLEGRIDMAVHSLKDLPTGLPDGLMIGAVPERHDPGEVLISRDRISSLSELKNGAVIATGSIRRQAQLLNLRPDIQTIDIRGNVNTRIDKFLLSNWDGLILARAGVERLGLSGHISCVIPSDEILPAIGQGALAIEIRENNPAIYNIINKINHTNTFIEVSAEREFLRSLGGGCKTPIAALAKVIDEEITIKGLVATQDGRNIIRDSIVTGKGSYLEAGHKLAQILLKNGADKIIEENFE